MRTILDSFQPGRRAPTLLVLLPPAKAQLEDLISRGFVQAVRTRSLPVDILLAEVGYQQVMAQTVAQDLRQHVIIPGKEAGYTDIWLAGVSMGAFNALTCAAIFGDQLAGLSLIAPYPGTADILNEMTAAGGPAAWASDPDSSHAHEREWWHWLWSESLRADNAMPVYLGLGSEDRFIQGQKMMASLIPASRTKQIAGDHSWPVWLTLWQQWLDRGAIIKKVPA